MKFIHYQTMTAVNHGTEEEPNIAQIFTDMAIKCRDESFDACYAIAQKEAYGEITVEDLPDPETPPSRLDELEAKLAYVAMMTDVDVEI